MITCQLSIIRVYPHQHLTRGIIPSVSTGLGSLIMQVLSGLGGFQDSLTLQTCLQRQQCLGIQGIIWLIQSYLTQHHQLVVLIRRRFICTWVHLSTSHTTRVVLEIGFWDCIYIYIIQNRSSMAVNLRGLDKYGSKHTGSQTNIQANIGGTYDLIRTDTVYIREGTFRVYIREGKIYDKAKI